MQAPDDCRARDECPLRAPAYRRVKADIPHMFWYLVNLARWAYRPRSRARPSPPG